MSDVMQRLDAIERVRLAQLPTPVVEAPRLAAHAGLARLLIKRDDMTGLALGGNKARKLEYDLAAAVRSGSDLLVTVGGTQSNHAAMTAAAGRRLGLETKLVLGGPDFASFGGNLALDVLYGAEIRYLVDDDDNDSLAAAMEEWVRELRAAGRRPFAVPLGGSTGAGALGYVQAVRELAAQLGDGPLQIITAVGSCGTFAGLNLGARLFLPRARVFGISVSRNAGEIRRRTLELVAEAAQLLGAEVPVSPGELACFDDYGGDYGVPTAAGDDAIRLAARLEGLVLDPVYTGKSMSGLLDLARRGVLDPGVPAVFLHTGGLPIVFAFEDAVRPLAECTKIRR
ncbi:MAG TPA: D-cysteine desulfhydrase family protein [Thermoanaerobaculales bacterium]|nr:D-cysteine desulfhydrase family protein [Thermoanaerobaculales bacterium]HQN95418.1 D-cysteine desulfhydrase family protein [Thermoanaerobaculales bacterium]HQP44957.1 D-cysteine desulfhydrase family protein [Thermoanaerobaculales bacterium]